MQCASQQLPKRLTNRDDVIPSSLASINCTSSQRNDRIGSTVIRNENLADLFEYCSLT